MGFLKRDSTICNVLQIYFETEFFFSLKHRCIDTFRKCCQQPVYFCSTLKGLSNGHVRYPTCTHFIRGVVCNVAEERRTIILKHFLRYSEEGTKELGKLEWRTSGTRVYIYIYIYVEWQGVAVTVTENGTPSPRSPREDLLLEQVPFVLS